MSGGIKSLDCCHGVHDEADDQKPFGPMIQVRVIEFPFSCVRDINSSCDGPYKPVYRKESTVEDVAHSCIWPLQDTA